MRISKRLRQKRNRSRRRINVKKIKQGGALCNHFTDIGNDATVDVIIQHYWDQTKALKPTLTQPNAFRGYIDFVVFNTPRHNIARVYVCDTPSGFSSTYCVKGDTAALSYFKRVFLQEGGLTAEKQKFTDASQGHLYTDPSFTYNEQTVC